MGEITPGMTVLEILCQNRQTEQVFQRYDAAAGVCLCCRALFDPLEELAQKYGLDLQKLLDDLEAVANAARVKKGTAPECGD
jgi:hypothetical protein